MTKLECQRHRKSLWSGKTSAELSPCVCVCVCVQAFYRKISLINVNDWKSLAKFASRKLHPGLLFITSTGSPAPCSPEKPHFINSSSEFLRARYSVHSHSSYILNLVKSDCHTGSLITTVPFVSLPRSYRRRVCYDPVISRTSITIKTLPFGRELWNYEEK